MVLALQDRLDHYLRFGVSGIRVIDPCKHRGWSIIAAGRATAADGIMRERPTDKWQFRRPTSCCHKLHAMLIRTDATARPAIVTRYR
jgi:hypothetical protein